MHLPAFFKFSARSMIAACSLVLVLVLALAACGSATSTSGSTPTPTSQPVSSPSASTSATLTTYTGNGYSIDYPQGWKVNAAGKSVVFTDPTGIYSLTVLIAPDPNDTISSGTVVNTALQLATSTLKNPQAVNVPASTTIGGDTWAQKSVAGTASVGNQTGTVQVVVASDNHPANSPSTNSYTITYQTLQATFATANSQFFQPMIQSFKFTS
jgi:hypothetical protein